MSASLYHAQLHDHYKNPRNYGLLEPADAFADKLHPSCGDTLSITLRLDNNHIAALGFEGKGCIISIASMSILGEYALSKTVQQLCALTSDDMKELIGMKLGYTRLNCATLGLETLQQALACPGSVDA